MAKSTKLPLARLGWNCLFTPDKDSKKYEAELIFPVGEKLTELKALIEEVLDAQFGSKKNRPEGLLLPILDQGEKKKYNDGFVKGALYVKTKSQFKPVLLDQHAEDLTDPVALYGGAYVYAKVTPKYYKYLGKEGVVLYIDVVQKVKDGDQLGKGRPDVRKDFTPVEDIAEDPFA